VQTYPHGGTVTAGCELSAQISFVFSEVKRLLTHCNYWLRFSPSVLTIPESLHRRPLSCDRLPNNLPSLSSLEPNLPKLTQLLYSVGAFNLTAGSYYPLKDWRSPSRRIGPLRSKPLAQVEGK